MQVGDPILIRHCSTSHYLAADLVKIKNEQEEKLKLIDETIKQSM